jgi:multisubunit Na+/H+ antiporter MnhE subunit
LTRWCAALSLLVRFPLEVVLSGWATAWLILSGGPTRQPGLVRLTYAEGLSETGAVVLGLLITLTPGTTTLDLDPARRELLLHVLDSTQAEAALAAIRRHFELPVRALFEEQR